MHRSSTLEYYSPSARQMNPNYARALVPALVCGYLLPTIIIYIPFTDADLYIRQGLIALWQLSPFIVNFLLVLFSELQGATILPSATKEMRPEEQNSRHVKMLYRVCLVVSVLSHFALLCYCMILSDRFEEILVRTFLPQLVMLNGSTGDILHHIFQVDFLVIFVSSLLWATSAVDDLRRARRAEVSLARLMVAVALGTVVIGPAATIIAIWWARENKIMTDEEAKTS